jgi:hypothetical protein
MRIVASQVFEFAQRFASHRARDVHSATPAGPSASLSGVLAGG